LLVLLAAVNRDKRGKVYFSGLKRVLNG
jgi:hypothetical protein